MKKYIKKPILVEAMQFEYTPECLVKLSKWMGDAMGTSGKERHPKALGWLRVKTLEDGQDEYKVAYIATEGDYILKGIQGEFWAVKPHIFESTYEEA